MDDQIRFGCALVTAEHNPEALDQLQARLKIMCVQYLRERSPARQGSYGEKRRKLRGKVEQIIRLAVPSDREKVHIGIEEADDLYTEIRVENVVADEKGDKSKLNPGEDVDVIVEANSYAAKKVRA